MTDFHLNTDSSPARIIQITDTHIGAKKNFLFNGNATLESLDSIISNIQEREQPDLVLVTGDLVHDPVETAYAMLLEQLARFDVPVFCLPGNHDDPVVMDQVLNCQNVSTAKQVRVNDWVILLLNTFVPGTHGGQLAESELQWLEERLSAQQNQPVLIALHHHPVKIHSPWMDIMMLKNAGCFFSVIDRFPSVKAVIWGHIHQQFEVDRQGIQLWGCPSTCIQFKPESLVFQEDSLSAGYRFIGLAEKGEIFSKVKRV